MSHLSYFPPASGNVTYPSTYYNEAIGITMTSPSMYMVINTISVYNDCGQVGPTMKDIVIPLDPTDVSTIALYTATDQQVNTTPPTMLTLTDIINGCSTLTMTAASTNGAIINDHAMANEYNKCFPALAIPSLAIETLGLPYYRHCGADNARFGLYDPPGAVPPVNGLLPTSTAKASTTSTAVAAQTPSTNQPVNTAIKKPDPTTTAAVDPVKSSVSNDVSDSSSTSSAKQPATSVNSVQDPATASDPAQPATSVNNVQAPTTIANSAQPATSVLSIAKPSSAEAGAPVPIATVGSEVISAAPGASAVVVGGQTASLQGQPITISSSIIQLTPSGLAIVNADSGSSSIYALPTSAEAVASAAANPQPIATLPNAQVISASAGASTLLVGSQTLTSGGPAVTLSGSKSIATFAADGLVIEGSSGDKTTYALPASSAPSQPIATIGNQIIAAPSAGASSLIIGSQTLALNGPAVTLAGSNAVATLGAEGLIVAYPGGAVSTYSAAAPQAQKQTQTQSSGSSTITAVAVAGSNGEEVVVQGKTLTKGGEAATLSDGQVVSLAAGTTGVVVMGKGGEVTTVQVVMSSLTTVVSSTGSMKGVVAVQTTSTTSASGSSGSGIITPLVFDGAGKSKDLGLKTLMWMFAMGGVVGMLI
ncbi:ca2+modulated nonselective cation channel polycystin protein [Rutstroemia sp. NJR-2017a WRK4]|nr:ca2+modulated nonselective cation channel polycystin protein [Rutstroemia sp. NJR-2017a WRK4]